MYNVILKRSIKKDKKWTVIVTTAMTTKTIHFGAKGYSDYTIHKDPNRKKRYINRHFKRENWNLSGINTAGFWSRWLLWNKPSIESSIKDIKSRFKITLKRI